MYSFSAKSKAELQTCDDKLQRVFYEVIQHVDCTIIKGHRTKTEQDECYRQGLSKLRYPASKHNSFPSYAVDAAPYFPDTGIPWRDHYTFCYFGGFVCGVAAKMGIKLRWGGDFDMNNVPRDQRFFDGVHFELIRD